MKISFLSSLGAKLFYLMSLLTLITILGITFQSSNRFRSFLTQQLQDSTTLQAERASIDVANILENWIGQLSVAVPTLSNAESFKSNKEAVAFINSNNDFVGLKIFFAKKKDGVASVTPLGEVLTTNTSDRRFEALKFEDVAKTLPDLYQNFMNKKIGKETNRFVLQNIAPQTKLPLMLIGVRFDVPSGEGSVWAVLVTWQTKLSLALPKSRFTSSSLIDKDGRTFSSPVFPEVVANKSLRYLALTRQALKRLTPSGFQDVYYDKEGKRWLGSFSVIPKFDGMTVLVQRDAEAAFLVITRSLIGTALWACFFMLIAVMFSFVGASSITRSLRQVTEATQLIAAGNFSYRLQPQARDEVGALSLSVNNMAGKIVSLMQSQVDKARFEKELETARMVQSTFFPKRDIVCDNLGVTGYYQPASECGGDLWGHFNIRKGVELIFIADAMGHGAPAALVTAMAYATCQAFSDIIKDTTTFNDSPSKMLSRLNRIIYEAVEGKISMTFFISVLDFNEGKITYANAGHNFPVIIPMSGSDKRIKSKAGKAGQVAPISLILQVVPLGVEPLAEFKEKTMDLATGDKIFYFTDGLIECTSPSGQVWGRKTLLDKLTSLATSDANELKNNLTKDVYEFFAGEPQIDDITIVVAEIGKDWLPKKQLSPAEKTA